VANYTGFPEGFLGLGQGTFAGGVPVQLPVLAVAGVFFWALVHRSVAGRGLEAIGYAPEAARHAGVPVDARLRLVYALSGTVAGLAALVYVARLGQAKADAGTGFELLAITAVVLGGTSIFGGRSSVTGTLLGLFVLALLQNGLRLSDQPAELAGILTGILLLLALALSRERKAP
jgi:rhamnose transport system permease protein